MINLAADLSYTRAIDESTYSDVNNYRVSLYKGETAIFQNQLYSDLELTQEVDFGETYTLTAFYGEDVAAGYDKLYVKGSETFSVAQGDTRMITLVCRPANAKFRVAYTLTIKPHKVDVEGGQFDLEITVDDGVTEEDITVTIPGDYI